MKLIDAQAVDASKRVTLVNQRHVFFLPGGKSKTSRVYEVNGLPKNRTDEVRASPCVRRGANTNKDVGVFLHAAANRSISPDAQR